MSAVLLDHPLLRGRRKLTRRGWVDVVDEAVEEKAERPAPIRVGTWPPLPGVTFTAGWLDGSWPRRGRTPSWWGRALHVEVGTRVVAELLRQNRHWPTTKGAAA